MGKGNFGTVYLGRDTELPKEDNLIAIKSISNQVLNKASVKESIK